MQISSQSNPVQLYQQHTDAVSQVSGDAQVKGDYAKVGAVSKNPQGDSVTFSADAKLLAEATRAASTEDGNRSAMIARLREQVQSGSYTPDPASIAQGIMREDSALFHM